MKALDILTRFRKRPRPPGVETFDSACRSLEDIVDVININTNNVPDDINDELDIHLAGFRRHASTEPQGYCAPLWLLKRPDNPLIPIEWSPPQLERPVSQLCTYEQMNSRYYSKLCAQLGLPADIHRKNWDCVFIYSAMVNYGILNQGARLLGFGVGGGPLPSAFARCGATILATGEPEEIIIGDAWRSIKPPAENPDPFYREDVMVSDLSETRVSFIPVDMRAIPRTLTGFDACWSSGALERLGGVRQGLSFIENSLDTLKPGGFAVHTTQFNLSSNDETLETRGLSLFRKRDIETIYQHLLALGHKVKPLNFYPGGTEIDAHIDAPPWSCEHLKRYAAGYVTTSLGLIIQKSDS